MAFPGCWYNFIESQANVIWINFADLARYASRYCWQKYASKNAWSNIESS